MPRRRRHAEIHLLRRVRTFLSPTTPWAGQMLVARNLVARGAGMVLRALINRFKAMGAALRSAALLKRVLLQVVVDAAINARRRDLAQRLCVGGC